MTIQQNNSSKPLRKEIIVSPSFHDVDPMGVVWHGNYLKFFEKVREALFAELHFSYKEMMESGYTWPVIEVQIKYRHPAFLETPIVISAEVKTYENDLKIEYEIRDLKTNKILTKGMTRQIAYDMRKKQGCLTSPAILFKVLGKECPYE